MIPRARTTERCGRAAATTMHHRLSATKRRNFTFPSFPDLLRSDEVRRMSCRTIGPLSSFWVPTLTISYTRPSFGLRELCSGRLSSMSSLDVECAPEPPSSRHARRQMRTGLWLTLGPRFGDASRHFLSHELHTRRENHAFAGSSSISVNGCSQPHYSMTAVFAG